MRPSPARIWRRRLLAFAGVAIVLAAIFLFWIRESSLFSVDKVEVTGVTVNQEQVYAALSNEAAKMTTLHVRQEKLRDAVSGFPTIQAIKVDANPPHDLKIEVIERPGVAVVESGGERIPVSAEGYLLRGMPAGGDLIPVELSQKVSGSQLLGSDVDQARLLAALPDELRKGVAGARVDADAGGVVIDLRIGIELRMGDGGEADAKWAAAAAVLAEPDLGSPGYIDVSVPERPVAGGGSG
jgi:cell division protein FtsQ